MEELTPDSDLLAPRRRASRLTFLYGVLAGCGGAIALAVGAALLGLMAIGVLIGTGHIPDSAAVPGEDLPAPILTFLRDEGLVEADEEVLFFYGDGLLSLREDGNLFTDRRVVSYWELDGLLEVRQATYPEIASIEPQLRDGFFETSEVRIERTDGEAFHLIVSPEGGQDERFVDRLLATWESRRESATSIDR